MFLDLCKCWAYLEIFFCFYPWIIKMVDFYFKFINVYDINLFDQTIYKFIFRTFAISIDGMMKWWNVRL